MSEFEDRINSILSDPEQMNKITNLAKSFMGGENSKQAEGLDIGSQLGIDSATIGKISRLINAGNSGSNEKQALLEAMKPYLSEKRRLKMDKALKLARFAKIAQLAMGEMGGDGD